MKLIAVVILCISAAIVKAGLSKEDAEALKGIASGCLQEAGATEADMEVMFKHLPAQNMGTKCLRACTMKKIGVMNGSGKFDREAALKLAEQHSGGDAEKIKIAEAITAVCSPVPVPDDHCEAAEVYKMCLVGEAKKHGISV